MNNLKHVPLESWRTQVPMAGICSIVLSLASCSDDPNRGAFEAVEWLRQSHADCLAENSEMVAVQNRDQTRSLEVWVDRWFMKVKTGDRSHLLLSPGQTAVQLGCSSTGGEEQSWEVVDARWSKP